VCLLPATRVLTCVLVICPLRKRARRYPAASRLTGLVVAVINSCRDICSLAATTPQITHSLTQPLKSIQLAMDMAAARNDGSTRTVVLRGGTHYLTDTIYLGAHHSNTRVSAAPVFLLLSCLPYNNTKICHPFHTSFYACSRFVALTCPPRVNHAQVMAYPGEAPVVSGGVKLNVQWTKATPVSARTHSRPLLLLSVSCAPSASWREEPLRASYLHCHQEEQTARASLSCRIPASHRLVLGASMFAAAPHSTSHECVLRL
jgi:hypothetical protein